MLSKAKLPLIVPPDEWVQSLSDDEVRARSDELDRRGVPDIDREREGKITREVAVDFLRDGSLSKSCRHWKIAAAAEKHLRKRGAQLDGAVYLDLIEFAGHISALSPRAKLPVKALGAAVAEWWINSDRWWVSASKKFHQTFPLPCGTPEHNRAEFYNLWFDLERRLKRKTQVWWAPTHLIVFVAFRRSFRRDELDRRAAEFEFNRLFERTGRKPAIAYDHARRMLRHTVAQVRRALAPASSIGDRWRRRTLTLNPLIVRGCGLQHRSAPTRKNFS